MLEGVLCHLAHFTFLPSIKKLYNSSVWEWNNFFPVSLASSSLYSCNKYENLKTIRLETVMQYGIHMPLTYTLAYSESKGWGNCIDVFHYIPSDGGKMNQLTI
jgi:hypothetical protein